MANRWIALPLLGLLFCCSCQEKQELNVGKGVGGGARIPSNWVIKITMDPDPHNPGQCLQQAQVNGGAWSTVPTYVKVKYGDHVQWASTYAAGANKSVFFSPNGSPDYPGTPMYNRAGDPVRSFALGNDPLGTSAKLTNSEQPEYDFSYTQVLIPDANGKLTSCKYPDPEGGMGVHVDN